MLQHTLPALLLLSLLPSVAESAQFTCGDLADPPGVTASDALGVLQTAVGLRGCSLCACDVDGSRKTTASDALLTLKKAVGQIVDMRCPFCCELCQCTPQKLRVTLSDIEVCEDCIPRVPISNVDIDSIDISISEDVNGEYEAVAVAECVWSITLPALMEKIYYGSGDSTCSGSPSGTSGDIGIDLRVRRNEQGWELQAGTYVQSLDWGDLFEAELDAETCDDEGTVGTENELCHLAGSNDPSDRDTHATGGIAQVEIADPQPVCP